MTEVMTYTLLVNNIGKIVKTSYVTHHFYCKNSNSLHHQNVFLININNYVVCNKKLNNKLFYCSVHSRTSATPFNNAK